MGLTRSAIQQYDKRYRKRLEYVFVISVVKRVPPARLYDRIASSSPHVSLAMTKQPSPTFHTSPSQNCPINRYKTFSLAGAVPIFTITVFLCRMVCTIQTLKEKSHSAPKSYRQHLMRIRA